MTDLLILGGTGKVGRRLTAHLTSQGRRPRPAGRNGPTRFDWHDENTWAPALDGMQSVFVVGPGSASDWSPRLASFLRLAHDTGVVRAVLLSARGVEFLPGGAVDLAEQALAEGPVPWTILRPTHFAQNFTEAMFVPQDGVIAAPVGTGAEPFVDVRDLAEVAAAVLTAPDGHWDGETLDLSGPAALDFASAARILSETAGIPVSFTAQSAQDHAAQLRATGTPEGYVRWRLAMLGGIQRGEDAYLSDGVSHVLGRPATSFQDWALREVPGAAWAKAADTA
jgi:uncharacterized protein YbjT (DUF2867 family)